MWRFGGIAVALWIDLRIDAGRGYGVVGLSLGCWAYFYRFFLFSVNSVV